MKTKLLQRVFCLAVCTVILACGCVNVFADELYESEGDTLAYTWANRNNYAVTVYWLNLNVPSVSAGLSSTNLNAGIQVWGNALNQTTPRLSPVLTSTTDWPANYWVANSIPNQTFFNSLYPAGDAEDYAGRTVLYSTLGNEITKGYYFSTEIAYAYIYYNPMYTSSSTNNWTNTVAHEFGHCLGFGHNRESNSIMNPSNSNITSLPQADRNDFLNKY